jgi:hypothetical protein
MSSKAKADRPKGYTCKGIGQLVKLYLRESQASVNEGYRIGNDLPERLSRVVLVRQSRCSNSQNCWEPMQRT